MSSFSRSAQVSILSYINNFQLLLLMSMFFYVEINMWKRGKTMN